MCKEQNVLNYYVLCNKLKNVIRTGWKDWKVKRERIESVAEHIYGVQMLAIAMKSEYQYDIDMQKVIFMLAIHELGETVIGDLTQFQISREEKEKTFKAMLLLALEEINEETGKTKREEINDAIIDRARKGDTKAYEVIRDTVR